MTNDPITHYGWIRADGRPWQRVTAGVSYEAALGLLLAHVEPAGRPAAARKRFLEADV